MLCLFFFLAIFSPFIVFLQLCPFSHPSLFLLTTFSSAAARVLLRPERVCLLVCRLSSTFAPSRDTVVSPSGPLLALPLSSLRRPSSRLSSPTLPHVPPTCSLRVCCAPECLPRWEFVVVVIVSVDSPCRCGISANPCSSAPPYIKRCPERSSGDGKRQTDR